MSALIDRSEKSRFEWVEDGFVAFADYRLEGAVLVIPHVEAAPELRGTGAAGRLLRAVMERAREEAWKVRPLCGYAAA
ncbi:MAG: GNAT family N-acetyltransferase [Verrucomicrobiales bacterium]